MFCTNGYLNSLEGKKSLLLYFVKIMDASQSKASADSNLYNTVILSSSVTVADADSSKTIISTVSVTEKDLSELGPLPLIATSFNILVDNWKESKDLPTLEFVEACDKLSILFNLLGVAFSFGGRDYIEKVKDLRKASETFGTLPQIVENDVKNGTVRKPGSHTRNLLRVKRGLELNKTLFQTLLSERSVSLKESASRAYNEVFAPYHSWSIRALVEAGMIALPSKQRFLQKLKEDEISWRKPAEDYVKSSEPVIQYVEDLFSSRNIPINW